MDSLNLSIRFPCYSMFLIQDTCKPFFYIQVHLYYTCLYLPWSNLLVCHRNQQFLKNAAFRMAIIGKSKGCVPNQNRSFYNRKGRSQQGKGFLKIGKAVRKQEKECSKTCCIYFKLHIYRKKY